MEFSKHTILGAGGSVGNALAIELLKNQQTVRLVSRSGFSIRGAQTYTADLTSYHETFKCLEDTDVAYLTVGLPYNSKIWKQIWPVIMKNVIEACKKLNVKLIYLDNVYMYGKADGEMTEDTPYNPCSKKGEVRKTISQMLEEEMNNGNIRAVIARAADLYGPYSLKTSLPYIMIISRIMRGKKAKWLASVDKKHSFTYTLDAARGMILLALNEECINQIWHLPTHSPAISIRDFIGIAAKELSAEPHYSILKRWMIKFAGLFNRTIWELDEMLYQYEHDYIFNSNKFNEYFNYTPRDYPQGIKETIKYLKNAL